MTKKYLKIFAQIFKSSFSLELIAKGFFEYGFYFGLLNFVFKNISLFLNYPYRDLNLISSIYLLSIWLYKFFLENALVFRYLLISGNFDLVLSKPINPLFRLMINKIDFVGLEIAILLILITGSFGNIPNLIQVVAGIIASVTVFILVLALLLKSSGGVPFERLLIIVFLIGLLGLGNVFSGPPVLLASILLFFASLKFWNFALTKYTSASS